MRLANDKKLNKDLDVIENQRNSLMINIRDFLGIKTYNQILKECYSTTKTGLEFINAVFDKSSVKYNISDESIMNIPASGPFIVIANHAPVGIDGLILLHIICKIRPDFKLHGNCLLNQIEPIKNYILPISTPDRSETIHSSADSIKRALQYLKEGKPVGIFPAGEVFSNPDTDCRISDQQWQKAPIRFIQKANVPVIPVYFHGGRNGLIYLMRNFHPAISTTSLHTDTYIKGVLNINIHIGEAVKPKIINCFTSEESLGQYLRAKTYLLNQPVKVETFFKFNLNHKNKFKEDIIDPVGTALLSSELIKLNNRYHLFTHGDFSLYCAPFREIPNIVREIGRLREITFREVGEGTSNSIDLDPYDIYYNHLIIWNNSKNQIAGAYRIGNGREIINQYGKNGFYISSLFKIKKGFEKILEKSFELGRSFIIKEYQRHPLVLFLLWKGILTYLKKNPEYEYLIGPVSISNDYSKEAKSMIVQYVYYNYFDIQLSTYIKPRKKFRISGKVKKNNKIILNGVEKNIKTIDLLIHEFQPSLTIPVLLKRYLQMNGKIIGFNVDHDFNNCLDGLILARIDEIPQEMIENLSR